MQKHIFKNYIYKHNEKYKQNDISMWKSEYGHTGNKDFVTVKMRCVHTYPIFNTTFKQLLIRREVI